MRARALPPAVAAFMAEQARRWLETLYRDGGDVRALEGGVVEVRAPEALLPTLLRWGGTMVPEIWTQALLEGRT